MFIEFDLKGSKARHKGVFDTTGFWVRFEPDFSEGWMVAHAEDPNNPVPDINGYKIFSHFSFAFYHENEDIALDVYVALVNCLAGHDWEDPEIGFIREVC